MIGTAFSKRSETFYRPIRCSTGVLGSASQRFGNVLETLRRFAGFLAFHSRVEPANFAGNTKTKRVKVQSAYIENKDFSELVERFVVSFGLQSLNVFIWKSLDGLYRNTYFEPKDYAGAYIAYPYRKKRGLFGEIHLVSSEIGAGYVAHELQHFLYDWLLSQTWDDDTNEKLATLAGDVTKDFWNRYYEVVECTK